METRAKFLEEITDINENYNTDLIGRAFETARGLHDGQLRKSGEPYLIHPIAVAKILAQLGMDDETIVGGLLHDVVEDSWVQSNLTQKKKHRQKTCARCFSLCRKTFVFSSSN